MSDLLRVTLRTRRTTACSCSLCRAPIVSGDRYADGFAVGSDGPDTYRAHAACHEAAEWLFSEEVRSGEADYLDGPTRDATELRAAVRNGWCTFGPAFGSLLDMAPEHVRRAWAGIEVTNGEAGALDGRRPTHARQTHGCDSAATPGGKRDE